jgi:hypothetical protein
MSTPLTDEGSYSLPTDKSLFYLSLQLTAGSLWQYEIRPSVESIMVLRLSQKEFDASKMNPSRLLENSLDAKRSSSGYHLNELWQIRTEGRYVLAIIRTSGRKKIAQGLFSSTVKRPSYCPPRVLHAIEEQSTGGVQIESPSAEVAECRNGGTAQVLSLPMHADGFVFTAEDYRSEEAMHDAGLLRRGDRTVEEYWRCAADNR